MKKKKDSIQVGNCTERAKETAKGEIQGKLIIPIFSPSLHTSLHK